MTRKRLLSSGDSLNVDWIAAILGLVGIVLVGRKKRIGFLFGMACNGMWVLYVLCSHVSYGILLEVVPLAAINAVNFHLWGKANGEQKVPQAADEG